MIFQALGAQEQHFFAFRAVEEKGKMRKGHIEGAAQIDLVHRYLAGFEYIAQLSNGFIEVVIVVEQYNAVDILYLGFIKSNRSKPTVG